MALSASEVAAKWAQGVAAGVDRYRAGVQGVTVAPTEAAIAAIPRYQEGVMAAVTSGRLERGLRRVTLNDWQRATIDKGAPRLATGARQAEPDVANFFTEFLPFLENVKRSLPARGNLEENLQRMLQNAREISQFQRTR